MSLRRAARAHGSRKLRKARLYLIGAGIGLRLVLRLCDIPSHSVPPVGAVAGMASLIGSTIGGALVGYSLWWVAWRTGLLTSAWTHRTFCGVLPTVSSGHGLFPGHAGLLEEMPLLWHQATATPAPGPSGYPSGGIVNLWRKSPING